MADVDESVHQRLDYAEKSLPRPKRDRRARQAHGYARRRLQAASAAAAKRGQDQDDDPATLLAMIDWLVTHAAVLRAEPEAGEYREWLPEHIRADPFGEIDREIDRLKRRLKNLAAQREQARECDRASARRALAGMRTADFASLSAVERAAWERRLGLDDLLPENWTPKSDALSRLPVSYDDHLSPDGH